jgi:hypothetical protein
VSSYGRRGRRSKPAEGKTIGNRYPGACAYCGVTVAEREGLAVFRRGRWTVEHRPATVNYVSGLWSGGCPDGSEQDALPEQVAEPVGAVVAYGGAGWSGTVNARGRCEDAPCCGCCT